MDNTSTNENTNAPVEPTTDNSPDFAAQIKDLNAQLEKVNGKNAELRSEKVSVNDNNASYKAKLSAQEERINSLQSQELRSNEQFDEALKLRQDTFSKKEVAFGESMSEMQTKNDGLNSQLSNLLIDGQYSSLLMENGVLPHMATAAVHVLKARGASISDGQALVNGQPLSDDFRKWISSEEAKGFLAATQNASSGSVSSSTGGAPTNLNKDSFSKMTLTEKGQLLNTDPELYAELNK